MNLDGIHIFVKVVETESFTKAAKALKMPVTTLSDKIAQLEKRLNKTLLYRTTRKLTPTTDGEIFYQYCVRALREIELGLNEIKPHSSTPEGLLRITCPVDIAVDLLDPVIDQYLKLYPKTEIELILSTRIIDLVAEGIDLAVRVGKVKDSNLLTTNYLEVSAALWATPSYLEKMGTPKHPKDLKKHDFVKFLGQPETFRLSNGKEVFDVKAGGRLFMDDMEALKGFVLHDHGIGVMPSFLGERYEKQGRLVKVLPDWRWGNFSLTFVSPAQTLVNTKVKAFIDLALN